MEDEKKRAQGSIFLKMLVIGFLIIVLMIPTGLIRILMSEREDRKDEAVKEVSSKWGYEQTVAGPILAVPYEIEKSSPSTENGFENYTTRKTAYFLPSKLDINGAMNTDLLKRGLYEITAYNSKMEFSGEFEIPEVSEMKIPSNAKMNWEDAYLAMSISDIKSLQDNLSVSWGDQESQFKPGIESSYLKEVLKGSELSAPMRINSEEAKNLKFSIKVDLNGTDGLNFVPLGATTNVKVVSDWASPSFDGSFLPDQRSVNDDGFVAQWNVLELNRNYSQVWDNEMERDIYDSSFGVKLLVMVDEYQKNERSIKYAIVLITLSFLVFFFVEVLNRIRIHPIQYILVGLSLVIFYLLLISITEHLTFNLAYLISSVVTVLLVTLYSKTVFKKTKLTLTQGAILSAVYVFIYSIMQAEDYALLIGSVVLFSVLAIVMFISRKVNWYEM